MKPATVRRLTSYEIPYAMTVKRTRQACTLSSLITDHAQLHRGL
jgi:hypothetical protein